MKTNLTLILICWLWSGTDGSEGYRTHIVATLFEELFLYKTSNLRSFKLYLQKQPTEIFQQPRPQRFFSETQYTTVYYLNSDLLLKLQKTLEQENKFLTETALNKFYTEAKLQSAIR